MGAITYLLTAGLTVALGLDPTFDSPVANVTGIAGQSITLHCSIENLGKYKVAWLDVNSLPMTYDDRRIIDDSRFDLKRPSINEWNLHLRDLRWDDRGPYRCTVNTSPIRVKLVNLRVKVPARINASLSAFSHVNVHEGHTLVLTCNATGVPEPVITWQRKSTGINDILHRAHMPSTIDGLSSAHICSIGADTTDKYVGHTLVIRNITRHCSDLYECTATNDVLQPAHHQVRVAVEFKPRVKMLNVRISQAIDRETMLVCFVTAYPQAVVRWEKDGQQLANNARHTIYLNVEDDHRVAMTIQIPRIIDDSDYGDYKCVAENNHGSDVGFTRLSKLVETSTAMMLPPTLKSVNGHRFDDAAREEGRSDVPYVDGGDQHSSFKARSIGTFDINAPSSERVVSSSARLETVSSPVVFWICAPLVVLLLGNTPRWWWRSTDS